MKTQAAFERERPLFCHLDVNNMLKTLICFNAPLTGFYASINSASYESIGYLCGNN